MNRSLSVFTCALCVVGGLAAIGIGKGILEVLGGAAVLAVIAGVLLGFSWLLHEWPLPKGRQPPATKPPPPEEKKPAPRWLQILEDDDREDGN